VSLPSNPGFGHQFWDNRNSILNPPLHKGQETHVIYSLHTLKR
jgi:hypothetical protein